MTKVWLITGSGNGLGRDIAEAALAAGDNVVAGARRTDHRIWARTATSNFE
jgi:NAD(P)-dependent dehydrogenase (short-subunit alcohol dehydrogenase family)